MGVSHFYPRPLSLPIWKRIILTDGKNDTEGTKNLRNDIVKEMEYEWLHL